MKARPHWMAGLLLTVLGSVGGMGGTAQAAAGGSALSLLPPELQVRQALADLPQLRASVLYRDLARADQKRLAAGQYEWTLRAG